jgi:hypothetical protein
MNKASRIARGGIYTALSVILLYLSSRLPTSRLTVIALSSAIIPLSIITLDIKSSILVYAATGILSFFLGSGFTALSYIAFFGLYGFVKLYVERLRKAVLEIVLKLAFFNSSLFIMYIFYTTVFVALPVFNFPIYYLAILAQVIFIVFDYALTILISYINKRFVK